MTSCGTCSPGLARQDTINEAVFLATWLLLGKFVINVILLVTIVVTPS